MTARRHRLAVALALAALVWLAAAGARAADAAPELWLVVVAGDPAAAVPVHLPAGKQVCFPDPTGKKQASPVGTLTLAGSAQARGAGDAGKCDGPPITIVAVPALPATELKVAALQWEANAGAWRLRLQIVSPVVAASRAWQRVLRVSLREGRGETRLSEAPVCDGVTCVFDVVRARAPMAVPRLDAVVAPLTIFTSDGQAPVLPVVGEGGLVNRWLLGPELDWDQARKKAILHVSLDRADTSSGRVRLHEELLRALLPPGGAGLRLQCTLKNAPARACASLRAADEPGTAAVLTFDNLPSQRAELRAAAAAGEARLAVPTTGIDLRATIDGTPADGLELQLDTVPCSYTATQLTTAVPGLEHAGVVYQITRQPASCPRIDDAVAGDKSPLEVEGVVALDSARGAGRGESFVEVILKAVPATSSAAGTLVFRVRAFPEGPAAKPVAVQVAGGVALDTPSEVSFPSNLVADGRRIQTSAPAQPAVDDAASAPGNALMVADDVAAKARKMAQKAAPKMPRTPAEPGSAAAPPKPAGVVDLTDRGALAVGRRNWIFLPVGDLSDRTVWTVKPGSAGHVECARSGAEHDPLPRARTLAVCIEALRETSAPLELALRLAGPPAKLALPGISAASRAALDQLADIQAGSRTVTLKLRSERHDLAMDLARSLTVVCSGAPRITSHSAIRALSEDAINGCRLAFLGQELPSSDLASKGAAANKGPEQSVPDYERRLADYGRQQLVVTVAHRSAAEEAKGSDFVPLPPEKMINATLTFDPAASEPLPIFNGLTQGGAVALQGFDQLRLTVRHRKDAYASDGGISFVDSELVVTVRVIPWIDQALVAEGGKGVRLYMTIPVQLALARYPSSGASALHSSDVAGHTERADFGLGLVWVLEPWDFAKHQPWLSTALSPQLNAGLMTTLPIGFANNDIVLPGLSLVAGLAVRLPPATKDPVDAALRAVLWWEHVFRVPGARAGVTPFDALMFGVGVNFGSFFD